MSLANDYFLLYHGITFEQNLDVEKIDTIITNDLYSIYALILSTTRKNCDKYLPLTSFKTYCQQLNVKTPSNISELNHLQHNIVENIKETKSKDYIDTLHESFKYLKKSEMLNNDDYQKLSSLFDHKELDINKENINKKNIDIESNKLSFSLKDAFNNRLASAALI